MNSRSSALAITLLTSVGCYHPPTTRPGHVVLASVERTIEAPWGHERIADLERRGDELRIVAAERTYCRPFEAGTLGVVDVQSASKKNDGRPMQPWDMMLMIGGGAAALGFGIIPALIDEPYEDGYLAGIGVGVGVFAVFGTVTIAGAALPNESRTEVASQVPGGRWSGPPAACGEAKAAAAEVQLDATYGDQRLGWRIAVTNGERFAVPQAVSDSLQFWSDACQAPLDIALRISDDDVPATLERARVVERDERMRKYPGGESLESGVDAGAGHHTLFGTNEVRLRWTPSARIKTVPTDAVISGSARQLGEACIRRAENDFVKICRAKVRDKHRPACATKCAADGNAVDCKWERDDCKVVSGTEAECTTLYDRCMAKKGLDAAGLQRCADTCLDDSAAVKEGNAQCDADWKKR